MSQKVSPVSLAPGVHTELLLYRTPNRDPSNGILSIEVQMKTPLHRNSDGEPYTGTLYIGVHNEIPTNMGVFIL